MFRHPQPVLFFIHGFLGSPAEWEAISGRYFPGYKSVCMALPGHGAPVTPRTDWKSVAHDMAALLDQHGVERAVLVGYSMGGRMALGFANRYPHRVEKLVLTSTHPGLKSEVERQARLEADRLLANRIMTSPWNSFLEAWYAQPLFGGLRQNEAYPDMIRRRMANTPQQVAQAAVRLSLGAQPDFRPGIDAWYRPVYLITGEDDKKYVDIAREWTIQNPFIRWTSLPQAGHAVYVEQPDRWVDCVRRVIVEP